MSRFLLVECSIVVGSGDGLDVPGHLSRGVIDRRDLLTTDRNCLSIDTLAEPKSMLSYSD